MLRWKACMHAHKDNHMDKHSSSFEKLQMNSSETLGPAQTTWFTTEVTRKDTGSPALPGRTMWLCCQVSLMIKDTEPFACFLPVLRLSAQPNA